MYDLNEDNIISSKDIVQLRKWMPINSPWGNEIYKI